MGKKRPPVPFPNSDTRDETAVLHRSFEMVPETVEIRIGKILWWWNPGEVTGHTQSLVTGSTRNRAVEIWSANVDVGLAWSRNVINQSGLTEGMKA